MIINGANLIRENIKQNKFINLFSMKAFLILCKRFLIE